ncbi:MAG: hypothetical protein KY476_08520 [Planctomycetes bacterium]|nr:hypothetical protein [Planctomycetota bacterium]
MTFLDILNYVYAQPFRPFRIQMVGGRTFDVRHPEMIRVGNTTVHVFAPSPEDDRVYERVHLLGLSLIESIEYLDASVTREGS